MSARANSDGSLISSEGPECPYCHREFTPDEGFYFDEARCTRIHCDECGNNFGVQVVHRTTWETRRLGALEG
jgi:hypothetical protein